MNANENNIKYARKQLEEANRRLESVRERATKIEMEQVIGALNEESEELILDIDQIREIPNEDIEYIVLETVEEQINDIEGRVQNVVIDCQMCIELSVKSMFKSVGSDFDYSHGISFDSHNTIDFNSKVPEGFHRKKDIIRAIFLTQLWESFYELAKYGAPKLNVGPSVIFDIKDGERAISDASFCVELAEEFVEFVEE